MKVTRAIVASHWEVDDEDVRCETCEYHKLLHDKWYCVYWVLEEDDKIEDNFCACWGPKPYSGKRK